MRPKYLITGILVLLCSFLLYQLKPSAHTDNSYINVELDGHKEDIKSVGDPAFSAYVFDVLDKRCPFIEPNGGPYIACIQNVVNEKEIIYTKTSPSIKEINDYCQSSAQKHAADGLISSDILLACRAYRLSE